MPSSKRLVITTIITAITLVICSAVSIYLVYDYYRFSRWPWLRFSSVMTLLTCLWAYVMGFAIPLPEKKTSGGTHFNAMAVFLFLMVPFSIDFFLMYPGPEALGDFSDPNLGELFGALVIIHGAGFYFVIREIHKLIRSQKDQTKA